jgi:hypothetical protein
MAGTVTLYRRNSAKREGGGGGGGLREFVYIFSHIRTKKEGAECGVQHKEEAPTYGIQHSSSTNQRASKQSAIVNLSINLEKQYTYNRKLVCLNLNTKRMTKLF